MANPSLDLRGGASGPSFEGSTPGHVLTVDANGKTVSPQLLPPAGPALVSFNGRTTPAAMPEAGDYEAEQIPYAGNAPGADVEAALDGLQDEIDDQQTDIDAAAATAATADGKAVAAQQPFQGTYYVNAAFAGTHTGSQSNPFVSVAAAYAFAALMGITRTIVYLPPGATHVENVTMPTTGEHEIAAQPALGGVGNVILQGNVDMSCTASARRSLTNLAVVGNLTGNCSAGTQRIMLTSAQVSGTTTLTTTGAGVQRLSTRGGVWDAPAGGNAGGCGLTGAVTISGTFWGANCIFGTSIAVTATSSFSGCDLPPLITTTGAVALFLTDCSNTVGGPLAFTAASGNCQLRPDFATLSELQRVGTTLTGTVSIAGLIGRSQRVAQITNVGVTVLSARVPAGLMVIECCLTLLANAGATAGNAVLNVVYTDATGTLVTEQVTTAALNVAGAVGSKARGALQFTHNGSGAVSYSVTGITNATALSYQCDVAIRQAS